MDPLAVLLSSEHSLLSLIAPLLSLRNLWWDLNLVCKQWMRHAPDIVLRFAPPPSL